MEQVSNVIMGDDVCLCWFQEVLSLSRPISLATSLSEIEEFDSMGVLIFVSELETKFATEGVMDFELIQNCTSVEDLWRKVEHFQWA